MYTSKLITLHPVAAKIGTSNKVAVSCNCKKSSTPQSKCKCRKNKVECSQYCHNSRRDCGNDRSPKASTDVTIAPRKEEGSGDKSTSEFQESLKPRSRRLKKRARMLTNSNRKQSKILLGISTHQNAKSETEMQQNTLFQYETIALVVNRLQELSNRSYRGKKGIKLVCLLFSYQNFKTNQSYSA